MVLNVEEFAKMAGYGVRRLLQSEPSSLRAVKGINASELKLQTLGEDLFCHSNPFYERMTATENEMLPTALKSTKLGKRYTDEIPKIQHLSTEDAAVFDKNGNLIAKPDKRATITFEYSDAHIDKFKQLTDSGAQLSLIHNHPPAGTLSAADIIMFLSNKFESIMAITPSGGYAFLSRNKPLVGDIFEMAALKADISALGILENLAIFRILKSSESNVEKVKMFDEFKDKQIKRFVEKHKSFDFSYEYKKGGNEPLLKADSFIAELEKGINEETLKKQFLSEGYSDADVEQMIKGLTDAPLDSFLLQA